MEPIEPLRSPWAAGATPDGKRGSERVRCGVCGSADVRFDEVIDRGTLFLAECARCERRWTSRFAIEVSAPDSRLSARRVVREAVPAA